MNYEYDATADALYISLDEAPSDRQVEMPDGTIVDLGLDGHLVGVDVMTPAMGWDADAVIERWIVDPQVTAFLRALAQWVPPTRNRTSVVRASGQGRGPEAFVSAA